MLKTPQNQKDVGLGFNGMEPSAAVRNNKFMTNQYTGHMNDGRDVKFPQMPNKKGNQGKTAGAVTAHGPGVTGRREFAPAAGQNFKGNPDKIQMTQMPNRKGNICC